MGASGASTKTSFLQRLLFAGAAALGLVLAIGFTVSFVNNRSLSNQVVEAARGITAAEASGMDLPSADALKRLETLRQSVETLSTYNRQGAPWRYRWGLYVGDDMLPGVRRTYFAKFHQLLLGGTQGTMLASLGGLPQTPGPEYGPTYDTLKAYLITTSHHDKSTREFLTPALMERWAAGRTVDAERQDLARMQFDYYAGELQLANMFSSENDGAAVEKARRYLAQFAGVEPIYRFMLAEAGKTNPPINFNKRFPGSAAVVVANYEVAGAFGKGGWDFMQAALKNPEKYFAGEPWVLGQQTGAAVDRSKLEAQLREMYHKDFIGQWRNYFKAAGVVKYGNVKDAAQKLNVLSGNQTPLLALFWLASQNTNVEEPKVLAALQPVHAVVPPASVDRYIADSNQNYMNALMSLQASIEQAAAAPGQPSDAAAAQTLGQAGAAKLATRQMAQAFRIDPEARLESTVQNLLEQPITYVESLLRLLGPAELNAKGKGLCAQFRTLMGKYPFNPASQTPATIQEVNALFRQPDGALWGFYAESLQKALPKQGAQYVAAPGGGVNLNPAFVSFFNRAAAFAEAAYAGGAQEPRIGYTLRPVPTEGTVATSLRIDGQTLAFSGGAPQPAKFVWQGGGTHEAVATVKFGSSDLDWANYQGLWAAFQFFGDAERWIPAASGFNVEWIVRVGKNPVTLEGRPLTVQYNLDMNGAPPIFQRGYFGGMGCVADVARP
jgi:type VI secretion system protein ImpL